MPGGKAGPSPAAQALPPLSGREEEVLKLLQAIESRRPEDPDPRDFEWYFTEDAQRRQNYYYGEGQVVLEQTLKTVVYGQDKAIEALSASIKLARAGLREPEKPIGCYLFSGPTGVGKTEVAKQLAASLGVELIRFDMSEYMERHTVSRLIGAPPGYVGFALGAWPEEA